MLDVQLCFISIEYVVFFPMVEYFDMVSENSGNKKGIVVEYRQYSDQHNSLPPSLPPKAALKFWQQLLLFHAEHVS